jgi:GTP-binding protein
MRTRFITSAASPDGFPETDLPEIALVGRSNVGKSSLVNALTGSKLARTSRTPGRTQLINFFELYTGRMTYLVADLPGRGFAKAPGDVRAAWNELVERYLASRGPLRSLLFLLDARRGAEADDLALHRRLIEILGPRGIGVEVVATKCDKLGKAELKPALAAIARALSIPPEVVIATSSSTRTGLELLRARIEASLSKSGDRPY